MRNGLFLVAATLLCAFAAASPLSSERPSTKPYIVKLKSQRPQFNVVSTILARNAQLGSDSNKIKYKYNPDFFNGIAGDFDEKSIADLKNHPDVEYVEEDGIMKAIGVQKSPGSWGLTRVSERKRDLKQPYVYPSSAGKGVDVWVVDTGVLDDLSEFEKRAKLEKSFVEGEEAKDLNGHGTHCAGTIGSKTYGIAKNVNLHAVKVLDADGSGSFSDVVSGIGFVASNAKKGKTVMSMSLGGPVSESVDAAVKAAVKAGVVVVVAAGNDGEDACNSSPAREPSVFTVGATDNTDTKADFSNHGKCVDIFAPGVNIKSLWLNGKTNTISGTSMAAPHVAGVAALLMADKDYASAEAVYADLLKVATPNVIKKQGANSPNLLLYNQLTPAEPSDPSKPKKPRKPKNPKGDDNNDDDDQEE